MIERAIPSTGEKIPVIGMGTWRSFDTNSPSEISQIREVINSWERSGGRVIDSSPMYGAAEEVIGIAVESNPHKDDLFYATKVWTTGNAAGIRQMEASLQKMRRKTMDLIQVHNLSDWRTHIKTLRKWKEEGKVRYIGLTHYTDSSHAELERIIKNEQVDFIQFNYSLINRNAELSLLPTAADLGLATIINRPFGEGAAFTFLSKIKLPDWIMDAGFKSWADVILKYIVGNPAVTCVIPATTNINHAVSNAESGMELFNDLALKNKILSFLKQI